MPDVFLSYSREDQAIARMFADGLKGEGFSVWWDQALTAGEAFDRVTEKALDDARAVVVLWSKRSVESRWVRAEATQAHAGNRLVPAMIEPCRRPILFELTQSADLSGWEGNERDPRWRAFAEGLRRLVDERGPAAEAGTTRADPPPQATGSTLWRRVRRQRVSLPAAIAVVGLAALLGALTYRQLAAPAAPAGAGPAHLWLPFDDAPAVWVNGSRQIAVSRDGSRVALAGNRGVWIRALGSPRPVIADVVCTNPFFSPDNAWLGCFSGNAGLVKVATSGGSPTLLASTPDRPAGATWTTDGSILFATSSGLFRVAQDGGAPELVAVPDAGRGERIYAWPELLPDGKSVLLTALSRLPDTPPAIIRLDLDTGQSRMLLSGGTHAHYAPTGHLVYAVGNALHAVRFDAATGQTRGAPVQIPDFGIASAPDNGAASFAIAENGTLVGLAPQPPTGIVGLFWLDAGGHETPLAVTPSRFGNPRVSPDGKRVAVDINAGGKRDIWIADLERSNLARLTSDPAEDLIPIWSPDGTRVYFSSDRSGTFDIYSQAADGSGEARVEVAAPGAQVLESMSPDGRHLLAVENFRSVSSADVEAGTLQPLLEGDAQSWLAEFSPDGRWIAYESREPDGRTEIYLRPFPDVRARREKISAEGGRFPAWGPKGSNALYFVTPTGEMMRAEVQLEPALRIGGTRKLFDWRPPPPGISGRQYDVAPDDRFLITHAVQDTRSDSTQAAVVLNWFGELSRLAP